MTRIVQFTSRTGSPRVGLVDDDRVRILKKVNSTYGLFLESCRTTISMAELAEQLGGKETENYDAILAQKRIRVPLDHPDPYHTWITGTGLTHLGSAASRNAMHVKKSTRKEAVETDSMRMFRMGVENGKMKGKKPAVQPEWFFKGNGLMTVDPEKNLVRPPYAMDGGEESEITGLYIIDEKGNPQRIGFSLGNEFSDHVMERINYLYLAHSKLRNCSYGPELLLTPLPQTVTGHSRIWRKGKVLWEKEFLSGEGAMSHNMANLEYHHFKYEMFRQPGDVHVHFFGTSVLSFADQVRPARGDIFEIESSTFGKPLRNPLEIRR